MSKSIFQVFGTNATNESEGIWIRYLVSDDEFLEVRIARAGGSNPRWNKAVDKHTKQLRRQGLNLEKLTFEQQRNLNTNVYVDSCILDWRGEAFREESGEPIPFNRENALRVFKALPEFFDYVMREALLADNFKDEAKEEELKN